MNFETAANSKLVADIGWTLLHSIWQIALVSAALLVMKSLLRNHSAKIRYALSVFALILSTVLPVVTFLQVRNQVDVKTSSNYFAIRAREQAERRPSNAAESLLISAGATSQDGHSTSGTGLVADLSRWLIVIAPDILPIAVFMWILGVAFFSLRLGGGFLQLRKYKIATATAADEYWQSAFSRISEMTGITQTVRLLRSANIKTPIAIGVLKPVIIIPASLFMQISPRELETIIAHELVHIRRYDPLVNIGQCIVEALLFYHPGIWWISSQIRREREFAADAAVLEVFEDSHVTYARALANLEEIRLKTNQQMPRYATAANGGNFMQRIQKILKIKTEASMANSAWTAGLAFLLTSAFLLAIFSFSSSELVNAQQRSGSKKLAIGFVSIPPLDRTVNPPKDSDATARLLIQELKEHKVPAIGFLQGGMISDGEKLFPVRANIARMWIDAGFELGLGGFKHIWLSKNPADDYIANIEKNEKVAKQLIGDAGLPPRYFSYPFLNTGKTVADKAKVEAWLASRGYTSVKYTIDNQEWMYSYAYDAARNDNDLNTMKGVRDAYLGYMNKMFDHYEAYSQDLFGRDIAQTMVLTPSRLITDTADEFFAMAAKRGYTFVAVDEAQGDPAYKTKEDFMGDAGISWFERWTMAKGQTLRKEPDVDRFVQKIWDERQATAKK